MSNPFEDIKEPRFNNLYVKGNARRMFSSNPDVYSYGTYENGANSPVDTGIVLPNYLNQTYYRGSNIGTVTAFGGVRCLAISRTYLVGGVFQPNFVTVYNLNNHTEIASLLYPGPATQSFVSGEPSVDTFIYDNKLYLTTYNNSDVKYYLYVLDNSLSWQLVAENVRPASVFSGKQSISDYGWWGVKLDNYVNSTTNRNPRLVKLSPGGALTEYAGTTAEFPGLAETGVAAPIHDMRVSNSRIYLQYSNALGGPDKILSWDISTGSPVVSSTQTIALPKLKTSNQFAINDGFVGRNDRSYGTVPLAWERVGYSGTHTFNTYSGPAPVSPSQFLITPINVAGWSRTASLNNSAAGYIRVIVGGVHASGIYRFKSDYTSELLLPIESDPASPSYKLLVDVVSVDSSNNRIYFLEVGGVGSPPHQLKYYTVP